MEPYDIDSIVLSAFDMDDLYHHEELRNSIISLVNPTHEKIKKTRDLLNKADLPKSVHHHISIRIELLEDITPRDASCCP